MEYIKRLNCLYMNVIIIYYTTTNNVQVLKLEYYSKVNLFSSDVSQQ